MKLSEKISFLRKEKGWSQEQLSSKLAVSRQAVYKWEAGIAFPEIDKLKKLCKVFNISFNVLMDDEVSLPINKEEDSAPELINEDEKNLVNTSEVPDTAKKEDASTSLENDEASSDTDAPSNSKTCPGCGASVREDFVFCTECGYSLSDKSEENKSIKKPAGGFCTHCGTRLEEGSAFCVECGTSVSNMLAPKGSDSTASNPTITEEKPNKSKKPLIITLIVALSVFFISSIAFAIVFLFPDNDEPDFLVTFVSDGETVNSEYLSNGDIIDKDFSLTKSGYVFEGWSQQENGQVDYQAGDAIISSGDLCLYAVWTPIEYTITYVLNGGKNDRWNPNTYNVESHIYLSNPTRDGYFFGGWYTDANLTKSYSASAFEKGGNITLYAKWTQNLFTFTDLGDGYCITSYAGFDEVVNIPSTDNGRPVTSISSQVFLNNSSIERINIPKQITSITASAFNGCTSLSYILVSSDNPSYKSIDGVLYSKDETCIVKYPAGKADTTYTVLDSVTRVGFCSFHGSLLEQVVLGDKVEIIDDRAFESCTKLEKINLEKSLVFICDESFYKCWSLKEIEVKGNSLRQIGHRAFEECLELESVSFPDSLYEIGDSAFKKCDSLKEFDLKNVEVLGSNVFEYTSMPKIFIPSTVKKIGSNLFLSSDNIVVLCEAQGAPSGWHMDWSTGASAVFFGKDGVNASAAEFSFEKNGTGTLKIISCVGAGKVEIPLEYDGLYMSEIGDNAFAGQVGITEIVIPKHINAISNSAFYDCPGLEKITVSTENSSFTSQDGVLYSLDKSEIIRYPQGNTNITFVVPDSVASIAAYAFYGCVNLKSVSFPNDSTGARGVSIIGTGAFEDCSNLSSIELGYLTSSFGDACFKNCTSLSAISIKCESVSKIGSNAFRGCTSLRSIDFDGVIEVIDSYAFAGCSALSTAHLGSPRNISTKAFENCTSLTKILIPGGVEVINANAFSGCRKLTAYCFANQKPLAWEQGWDADLLAVVWGAHSIPSSEDSFSYTGSGSTATITGCTDAGVINIPQTISGKTVIAIGAGAFSNLYGITEIVIPATVKTIDVSAFENCFDLQKITYEGSPTYFGSIDGVLYSDNNKLLLKYPEGKTDESFTVPTRVDIIKSSAFKNNQFIKHITLPDNVGGDNYVGKIEAYAFYGCTSLESINLGHVNYFERECFKNCQSLKAVTFEAENVWGIGNDAFLGCTSLESVTFLGNVSEIGYQCFEACASLKSVQFAKNCDKLSSRAFSNCTSLKEISLPANLTAIHTETFFACTSLEKVTMSSTITKIESDAFKSCVLLKEIYLHKEIISIGKGAFSGCVGLTIKCEADSLPSGWESGWCDDLSKVILNA